MHQFGFTLLPGGPVDSPLLASAIPFLTFLPNPLSSSSSPSAHTESISPVPPSAVPTGPRSSVGAILLGGKGPLSKPSSSSSSASFCASKAAFSSLATCIAARYWPYLLPNMLPPSPEEHPLQPVLGSSISVPYESEQSHDMT